MVVKIICGPSSTFQMKCGNCGTEFTYQMDDLRRYYDNDKKGRNVIECPTCSEDQDHPDQRFKDRID